MRGVLVSIVVAVLGSGCFQRAAIPNYAGSQKVGKTLALSLPVHGSDQVMDLAEQKGKVILLDVWATWCEPCVTQLEIYQDLQKEYGDQGFQVYAITVDEDLKLVDRFLEEHKLELPVLVDSQSTASEEVLGVNQLPTSFLVDRKGVVRQVHEGFNEAFLGVYQKEIEALLAEPE